MKTCKGCGESKPLDDFAPYRKTEPDRRRSRCRLCESKSHHAWRRANLAKRAEYMRAWKELNADAWTTYMKEWEAAHPGYKEQWAQDNADAIREYTREWREQNRDRSREYARRHRAGKLAVPSEDFDPTFVFERDAGVCGICAEPVDPDDWHLDHIHPLSRGGHHTLDNVQVAHPRCNRKKGAKVLATEVGF